MSEHRDAAPTRNGNGDHVTGPRWANPSDLSESPKFRGKKSARDILPIPHPAPPSDPVEGIRQVLREELQSGIQQQAAHAAELAALEELADGVKEDNAKFGELLEQLDRALELQRHVHESRREAAEKRAAADWLDLKLAATEAADLGRPVGAAAIRQAIKRGGTPLESRIMSRGRRKVRQVTRASLVAWCRQVLPPSEAAISWQIEADRAARAARLKS